MEKIIYLDDFRKEKKDEKKGENDFVFDEIMDFVDEVIGNKDVVFLGRRG